MARTQRNSFHPAAKPFDIPKIKPQLNVHPRVDDSSFQPPAVRGSVLQINHIPRATLLASHHTISPPHPLPQPRETARSIPLNTLTNMSTQTPWCKASANTHTKKHQHTTFHLPHQTRSDFCHHHPPGSYIPRKMTITTTTATFKILHAHAASSSPFPRG